MFRLFELSKDNFNDELYQKAKSNFETAKYILENQELKKRLFSMPQNAMFPNEYTQVPLMYIALSNAQSAAYILENKEFADMLLVDQEPYTRANILQDLVKHYSSDSEEDKKVRALCGQFMIDDVSIQKDSLGRSSKSEEKTDEVSKIQAALCWQHLCEQVVVDDDKLTPAPSLRR